MEQKGKMVLAGLCLAVVSAGGLIAWREHQKRMDHLAADMVLIENVQEYVTSFTMEFLSYAAEDALVDGMEPTRLSQIRQERIQTEFSKLDLRNPYTGEDYLFLRIIRGAAMGPVLFSTFNGTIILTDELLELCGHDNGIIAGLLMHEVAHRHLHHSKLRLIAAALPEDRPDLIREEFQTVADSYGRNPLRLRDFEFGHDMEQAARDYADEHLRETGLPTGGFERCLANLERHRDRPGIAAFLKAHRS